MTDRWTKNALNLALIVGVTWNVSAVNGEENTDPGILTEHPDDLNPDRMVVIREYWEAGGLNRDSIKADANDHTLINPSAAPGDADFGLYVLKDSLKGQIIGNFERNPANQTTRFNDSDSFRQIIQGISRPLDIFGDPILPEDGPALTVMHPETPIRSNSGLVWGGYSAGEKSEPVVFEEARRDTIPPQRSIEIRNIEGFAISALSQDDVTAAKSMSNSFLVFFQHNVEQAGDFTSPYNEDTGSYIYTLLNSNNGTNGTGQATAVQRLDVTEGALKIGLNRTHREPAETTPQPLDYTTDTPFHLLLQTENRYWWRTRDPLNAPQIDMLLDSEYGAPKLLTPGIQAAIFADEFANPDDKPEPSDSLDKVERENLLTVFELNIADTNPNKTAVQYWERVSAPAEANMNGYTEGGAVALGAARYTWNRATDQIEPASMAPSPPYVDELCDEPLYPPLNLRNVTGLGIVISALTNGEGTSNPEGANIHLLGIALRGRPVVTYEIAAASESPNDPGGEFMDGVIAAENECEPEAVGNLLVNAELSYPVGADLVVEYGTNNGDVLRTGINHGATWPQDYGTTLGMGLRGYLDAGMTVPASITFPSIVPDIELATGLLAQVPVPQLLPQDDHTNLGVARRDGILINDDTLDEWLEYFGFSVTNEASLNMQSVGLGTPPTSIVIEDDDAASVIVVLARTGYEETQQAVGHLELDKPSGKEIVIVYDTSEKGTPIADPMIENFFAAESADGLNGAANDGGEDYPDTTAQVTFASEVANAGAGDFLGGEGVTIINPVIPIFDDTIDEFGERKADPADPATDEGDPVRFEQFLLNIVTPAGPAPYGPGNRPERLYANRVIIGVGSNDMNIVDNDGPPTVIIVVATTPNAGTDFSRDTTAEQDAEMYRVYALLVDSANPGAAVPQASGKPVKVPWLLEEFDMTTTMYPATTPQDYVRGAGSEFVFPTQVAAPMPRATLLQNRVVADIVNDALDEFDEPFLFRFDELASVAPRFLMYRLANSGSADPAVQIPSHTITIIDDDLPPLIQISTPLYLEGVPADVPVTFSLVDPLGSGMPQPSGKWVGARLWTDDSRSAFVPTAIGEFNQIAVAGQDYVPVNPIGAHEVMFTPKKRDTTVGPDLTTQTDDLTDLVNDLLDEATESFLIAYEVTDGMGALAPDRATIDTANPWAANIQDDDDPPIMEVTVFRKRDLPPQMPRRNFTEPDASLPPLRIEPLLVRVRLTDGSGNPRPSGKRVEISYITVDGQVSMPPAENSGATAPQDYSHRTGQLVYTGEVDNATPGQTEMTWMLNINDDTIDEFDEEFNLTYSLPDVYPGNGERDAQLPAEHPVPLTIEDNDDEVRIVIASVSPNPLVEGNDPMNPPIANITVQLVDQAGVETVSGKPVTVDFGTTDDSAIVVDDYSGAMDTIVYDPVLSAGDTGTSSDVVNVPITSDLIEELLTEDFVFTLSNEVNAELIVNSFANPNPRNVTIFDDDGTSTILCETWEMVTPLPQPLTVGRIDTSDSEFFVLDIGGGSNGLNSTPLDAVRIADIEGGVRIQRINFGSPSPYGNTMRIDVYDPNVGMGLMGLDDDAVCSITLEARFFIGGLTPEGTTDFPLVGDHLRAGEAYFGIAIGDGGADATLTSTTGIPRSLASDASLFFSVNNHAAGDGGTLPRLFFGLNGQMTDGIPDAADAMYPRAASGGDLGAGASLNTPGGSTPAGHQYLVSVTFIKRAFNQTDIQYSLRPVDGTGPVDSGGVVETSLASSFPFNRLINELALFLGPTFGFGDGPDAGISNTVDSGLQGSWVDDIKLRVFGRKANANEFNSTLAWDLYEN